MFSSFIEFRTYDLIVFFITITFFIPAIIYAIRNYYFFVIIYFITNAIYNLLIILAADDNIRLIMIYVGYVFCLNAIFLIKKIISPQKNIIPWPYFLYLILPFIIPITLISSCEFISNMSCNQTIISGNYITNVYLIYVAANLTYLSAVSYLMIVNDSNKKKLIYFWLN